VHARVGDGYAGWPKHAPYDAVIVTAAPDHVPQPLVDQLAVGGRLVIPVGDRGGVQQMTVITKRADGLVRETVMPVRFVPLVRP
jgi:protein-L-isoaspartate(D-aspartate) O-methyltransferase